jgi:hypothetical protein
MVQLNLVRFQLCARKVPVLWKKISAEEGIETS